MSRRTMRRGFGARIRRKAPRLALLCAAALLAAPLARSSAEDWPTFRHDNRRSGRTSEHLEAGALHEAWTYRSSRPPRPAWAGPARWDAFARIRGLRAMRNYDAVFHASIAGGAVFFGSSSDDCVHCLDAASGRERWFYPTGGPVRIAPTISDGNVTFGSDDGFAYCLDAATGRLVWKYSPAPRSGRVIQDGRLISFWPCRTGVLVDGGKAYFAASLFPWKPSYLCALDAATGSPRGDGCFARQASGTFEGALLALKDRLISPQGRVAPLLFRRGDGASLGRLKKGGGGCFVLVTPDDHVLHGPGNKTGWITDSSTRTLERIATFQGGNAVVVSGTTAFLLTDDSISAIDRSSHRVIWTVPESYPCAMILADDTLFAGGVDRVAALRASDGSILWRHALDGRAYGLAVAAGALYVSTDTGSIACFRTGGARTQEAAAAPGSPPSPGSPAPSAPRLQLALEPYWRFDAAGDAMVFWRTDQPAQCRLEYTLDGRAAGSATSGRGTDHAVRLRGLRHNRTYTFAVRSGSGAAGSATKKFELDTFFTYAPAEVPAAPDRSPSSGDEALAARSAAEILRITKVPAAKPRGICLVLGVRDGRLAYELARQSSLRVIAVDTDAARVAAVRRALVRTGVHGARVCAYAVDDFAHLPFAGCFADLIVSETTLHADRCPGTARETFRLLRPEGGVACIGRPAGAQPALSRRRLEQWLEGLPHRPAVRTDGGSLWATFAKGRIAGAGAWTHQYGRPDNSAFGGEELSGAVSTNDLEVQWVGRPGPRAQADRNGRKPAPLAAAGRLFVQGLQRIIAVDAYNGTVLWAWELPAFGRFNMPRDCGNWCADDEFLFAAIGGRCWRFDANTGRISKRYPVVKEPLQGRRPGWDYDWSYVARDGDLLLGSAVRKGTGYTNFWGASGEGWYDARSGPVTFKVCSENLFALQRDSGRTAWAYARGVIVNPSLTIGARRIFFLECRNPAVLRSASRRVGGAALWRDAFLVALRLDTGEVDWEEPFRGAPGSVVLYAAYASGKLVLVSSSGKQYHVAVHDAAGGQLAWKEAFAWPGDNHGKHMSRPAIAGGKLFVRPRVFDLYTGKPLSFTMPDGGCGTYALTQGAVFYRAGNISMWSPGPEAATSWSRLRPGCWLSAIPACGMLLAPEAGGGCSCGSWMETSIGFLPKKTAEVPQTSPP